MKLFAMKSVIGWHMQKIKLFETWQLAQFELLSVEEHVFYLFNIGITLNLSSLCAICDHWQNYRLIKYHMCEAWFCVLALFYRNYGAIWQSSSANICSSIFNLSGNGLFNKQTEIFGWFVGNRTSSWFSSYFFFFVRVYCQVCLLVCFFFTTLFFHCHSRVHCVYFSSICVIHIVYGFYFFWPIMDASSFYWQFTSTRCILGIGKSVCNYCSVVDEFNVDTSHHSVGCVGWLCVHLKWSEDHMSMSTST